MSKRLTTKQAGEAPPKVTKRLRGKQPASEAAGTAPPEEAAPEAAITPSKYDELLRKIYYDVEEGFGSIDKVYKEAKKKDPTITKKIVKEFLDRQALRQKKKDPKWNSWVANGALETIQVDIAHMPKRIFGQSEFKYALFEYDVFRKSLLFTPLSIPTLFLLLLH